MRHKLAAIMLLASLPKLAAAAPAVAIAVEEPAAKNTVVIKLGEHLAVEYERAVNPKVALFVGPALFADFASNAADGVKSELGIGAALGARFFVTGEAPEGLFVGPVVNVAYARIVQQHSTSTGLRLSSGAMLGYTWIFGNMVDLSLGAGANYVNLMARNDTDKAPAPIQASLRAAVGVAF